MIATDVNARHRSMLRAIAEGRGQLQIHPHPTLCVDGLWCDFTATNDLIANALIQPAFAAPTGTHAPAILTTTGIQTLAALSA